MDSQTFNFWIYIVFFFFVKLYTKKNLDSKLYARRTNDCGEREINKRRLFILIRLGYNVFLNHGSIHKIQ